MLRTSSIRASLCVATCLVAVVSPSVGHGQDFGIESKVYDGRDLISSTTTLFDKGRIYDFLAQPDETIILAPDDGRIVLLDNTRKLRTEVTTEMLEQFCESLRQKAERSTSESVRFYAAPQFREQLDADTDEVVLSSPWLEYRVKTVEPPNGEVLRQYEKYVQWQSRLNALMNPGAPPPNPRLELNAALARRQLLAEEVSMRRTSLVPGMGKSLRAEHRFTWRLDDPDRRRIDEALQRLTAYQLAPLSEYLRPAVEQSRR